jgi:hypothetical protein
MIAIPNSRFAKSLFSGHWKDNKKILQKEKILVKVNKKSVEGKWKVCGDVIKNKKASWIIQLIVVRFWAVFHLSIALVFILAVVSALPVETNENENLNYDIPSEEGKDNEYSSESSASYDNENADKMNEIPTSENDNDDNNDDKSNDEDDGVPYQEVETKKPELSPEMKEKIYGIPMEVCKTLDDPKKPLHIRWEEMKVLEIVINLLWHIIFHSHPTLCGKKSE